MKIAFLPDMKCIDNVNTYMLVDHHVQNLKRQAN